MPHIVNIGVLAVVILLLLARRSGVAGTYRPNPWIGLIVIALLIVRIGYRVTLMHAPTGATTIADATSQASVFHAYAADPWTAGAFFILATYYIAYFIFLLQKERKLGLPDVI